jgi:hypothetical protein
MAKLIMHPIVITPTPQPNLDFIRLGEPNKHTPWNQGQLALNFSPMPGRPAFPEVSETLQFAGSKIPSDLPDPSVWAARLITGVLEVLAGSRSVQQLTTMLSPEVYNIISIHAQRMSGLTPRHRPMVRSVRVCLPSHGVAEAAVVIQGKKRSRAIALRLEMQHSRWRCTAIIFG